MLFEDVELDEVLIFEEILIFELLDGEELDEVLLLQLTNNKPKLNILRRYLFFHYNLRYLGLIRHEIFTFLLKL